MRTLRRVSGQTITPPPDTYTLAGLSESDLSAIASGLRYYALHHQWDNKRVATMYELLKVLEVIPT